MTAGSPDTEPVHEAGSRPRAGSRALDLLVLGEVNPDVVVRAVDPRPAFGQVERVVDEIALTIGSSSVIFACGAARLGLRVAFVGVVGDDPLGRFMVAAMAERGVDAAAVRVDPAIPTGASVILSAPADRAILTTLGTMPLLRADDVPAGLLARARHVHVGSFFLLEALRPDLPALFARVRARGGTTSLDPNWDPSGEWDRGLRAVLPLTDVFFPNATEAARISGRDNPAEAAGALVAAGARAVAVKLGPDGGLAADSAGRLERVSALAVEPVDTTGAGDSFDAGFLAGMLHGRSLRGCLELAVACGSLSTLGVGGTAAQPTLAEADAALARLDLVTHAPRAPEVPR